MKRGGPLKRRTELKATKPMDRGEGIKWSANPPKRKASLPTQSKKRQRENRERRKVVTAKYGTGPVCCEVPWCARLADDAHEPLTRARGGSITNPDNIRAVCRPCHDEIGAEPDWAYELGFLKHSWEAS